MKRAAKKEADSPKEPASRLYTLEVFIVGGLMSERFLERNPQISRTIQIRGDQTLEDLHYAIFDAFDRFDEHMYEFQFGKGPNDPKGERYVMQSDFDLDFGPTRRREGDVAGTFPTTIDSLGLKVNRRSAIGSISATIGGTRSTSRPSTTTAEGQVPQSDQARRQEPAAVHGRVMGGTTCYRSRTLISRIGIFPRHF